VLSEAGTRVWASCASRAPCCLNTRQKLRAACGAALRHTASVDWWRSCGGGVCSRAHPQRLHRLHRLHRLARPATSDGACLGQRRGCSNTREGAPGHAARIAEPLHLYPSLLGAGYAACADPAPHGESHALEDDLPQRSRHTATKPLAARLPAECFLILVFAVAADPSPLFTCLFFLA
jgi:hypothetical protein